MSPRFLRTAAFALFALLAQVVDEQKRLREAPDDNLQWAVFQLQNEFNRAYRAVLEFDPQSTSSIDELKLSYDILYSRMELVSTAPTFAQVRSAAGWARLPS